LPGLQKNPHEIKGSLKSRPSFSDPLQVSYQTTSYHVFEQGWLKPSLSEYEGLVDETGTVQISRMDISQMARPQDTIQSVSVYGDNTTKIGPRNLDFWGNQVDEFEVVPFSRSMRTALGL
jgi:hypothetical protein